MARDGLDARLQVAHEHDAPGDEQNDGGTDGGSQVRVDVFHTDFGEDCREGGKEC